MYGLWVKVEDFHVRAEAERVRNAECGSLATDVRHADAVSVDRDTLACAIDALEACGDVAHGASGDLLLIDNIVASLKAALGEGK